MQHCPGYDKTYFSGMRLTPPSTCCDLLVASVFICLVSIYCTPTRCLTLNRDDNAKDKVDAEFSMEIEQGTNVDLSAGPLIITSFGRIGCRRMKARHFRDLKLMEVSISGAPPHFTI